jgi:hypothetical protein
VSLWANEKRATPTDQAFAPGYVRPIGLAALATIAAERTVADSFTPTLNLRKPEVSAANNTWGGTAGLNSDLAVVDRVEEPEEADPIAVELVMRTILDRGDAADWLSVAEREEELPVGLAVKRIRFGIERVADGDAQRRYPLRVVGGVIDLPREIDEAAQIPRGTD